MIKCQTRQWGNSIGIILPKRFIKENNIHPHEEILVEIKGKSGNILKELFGSGKDKLKRPTAEILKETRKELENKF